MGQVRSSEINRKTKETDIRLRLDLDGGDISVDTGIGFFKKILTVFQYLFPSLNYILNIISVHKLPLELIWWRCYSSEESVLSGLKRVCQNRHILFSMDLLSWQVVLPRSLILKIMTQKNFCRKDRFVKKFCQFCCIIEILFVSLHWYI